VLVPSRAAATPSVEGQERNEQVAIPLADGSGRYRGDFRTASPPAVDLASMETSFAVSRTTVTGDPADTHGARTRGDDAAVLIKVVSIAVTGLIFLTFFDGIFHLGRPSNTAAVR
jgi:hypothetical protein